MTQTLKGSIRETPLPDIIQIVCLNQKTGYFSITQGPYKARLYIQDGKLVHAVTATYQGVDVLDEIASWIEGQYYFEETDIQDVPRTITTSTTNILLKFDQRISEWQTLGQRIPDIYRYPYKMILDGETIPSLNPRELFLMDYLTGYYSIEELAIVLNKPLILVAKTIYGLIIQKHVVLMTVQSSNPPNIQKLKGVSATISETGSHSGSYGSGILAPSSTPGPALPEPAPESKAASATTSSVENYLKFAQRIRDTALRLLPLELHQGVTDLYEEYSRKLLEEGANIKLVTALAGKVSNDAVNAYSKGQCPKETVAQLNTELKRLFGKA